MPLPWLKTQGQKSSENLSGFVSKWFHKSFYKPWITLVRVSTSGPWRLDLLSISDRELEAILTLTRALNLMLLAINSGKLALALEDPETKNNSSLFKARLLSQKTYIKSKVKDFYLFISLKIINNIYTCNFFFRIQSNY